MRKRMVALVGVIAVVGSMLLLSSSPASSQNTQIRTSDNYRLGGWQDPVRGKSGPGLAVNPVNPNNVVETQIELVTGECEYNSSFDGGNTWNIGGKLTGPSPTFPQGPGSCSVLGHGATAVDNGLEFGTGSNVYAAFATAPCANPAQDCTGAGAFSALVARSTNGGLTFANGVVALPAGALGATGDMAFPKLDVFPGAGTNGADKIVLAANPNRPSGPQHGSAGEVLVTVSNDSGATWSTPVAVNPAPTVADPFGAIEHTHPLFGENANTIYVAWRTSRVRTTGLDPATGPLNGPVEPGFIRVAKSTDGGLTWTITNATEVRAEPGFTASSFPRLAVDRTNGNLYLVWNQDAALYGAPVQAQDHFMIKTSQVWFSRSTNDNATWTDRQLLSEPVVAGYQTQTRHPNVEVAPNGRVDVAWHDRRHMVRPRVAGNPQGPACLHTHFPCVESKLGDTYWSFSNNQGANGSFSESRRITDRSHNNDVGYDYRFSTYWDFGPVMDHQGINILHAWMDSREGNHFDNDTQDIYLAKTNFNGPANIPVRAYGTYDPPGFSVRFSQLAQPGGGEGKQASTFASTAATRVVIANQSDIPSILAGAVLARAFVGPMLVTPADTLPQTVRDEIVRVQPVGAYLVGDTTNLSPQIEADLASVGVPTEAIIPDAVLTGGSTTVNSPSGSFDLADINHPVTGTNVPPGTTFRYVTTLTSAELSQPAAASSSPTELHIPRIIRLAGPTPADTAAAVARQLDRRTPTERASGGPAFDAVIIADPESRVAPMASILAAHRRLPYLFVNKNDIPAVTNQALTDLNINRTLVIQGNNALNPSIATTLTGQGQNPTTFAGTNGPATSEAILQASITTWGLPANQVFVQDSDNPLHGALLGQPGARIGGLQLAVPGGDPGRAQNRLNGLGLNPGLDRLITSNVVPATQAVFGVFRPSSGTWFLQNGTTTNHGAQGDIPVYADYNGDGTNEVAVFRPSSGTWFIQNGDTVQWGTNGDIPVPGDYNGDGSDEIAVFRPSTGTWFIRNGPTVQWGTNGDIPVPADYDGDGDTDIAVFRPSTGTWFIQGGPTVQWGTNGDIPVPADYDGDGDDDIAVWRPSTGTWFVHNGQTLTFGTNGDIPVPFDYDGDGDDDFAVWRPSTGQLFINGQPTQAFGTSGDVPVTMSPSTYQFFF